MVTTPTPAPVRASIRGREPASVRRWAAPAVVAATGVIAAALALAGCAPKVRVDNPSPFDEDDPLAGAADIDSRGGGDRGDGDGDGDGDGANPGAGRRLGPPKELGEARPGSRIRTDTVTRAALMTTLQRGPGVFLRGVEVKPSFQGQRFVGWEIVQFMPGETRFDPYDLRPGDVIVGINGKVVARPQHLHALWAELGVAEAVVVGVRRGGQSFEIRLEIADPPGRRDIVGP